MKKVMAISYCCLFFSQLNGSSASGLGQRGPLNRECHRDLLTETKSTPLKMQPTSGRRVVPELHFYIVTWNMNSKPPLNSLENILDVVGEKYDFYVIGFQEAPNFSAEALITQALGDTYCCVAAAILTSLQLFVFAKKSLQPHITGPRVDKVGVGGFGTVVGRQKGAAAVAFYYKKVSLLFITSHLSPHECNMEERNAQYTRICQTIFARQAVSCSCIQMSADVDEPYCKLRVGSNFVEKTDVVIWLGDLNYRVELPRSSVGFLISHNLEKVLWAKDQLSRAVQRGEVFKGFQEGPLLFPPTYKYDIGTDNYDTSSKERVPSWTDRILYKVMETSFIKANLRGYTSINSVKTSDHRPVKAHLTLINMKNSS
ncbi:unnamed protein product [Sphagnum troendelagicum]|uniref:Inositol polyphosphate-related phosphatase domain-containing protein n=1 Tax=Sphagnum troendelagicum TaxID=128251 RepID=A0ABP0UKS4_9BRYO